MTAHQSEHWWIVRKKIDKSRNNSESLKSLATTQKQHEQIDDKAIFDQFDMHSTNSLAIFSAGTHTQTPTKPFYKLDVTEKRVPKFRRRQILTNGIADHFGTIAYVHAAHCTASTTLAWTKSSEKFANTWIVFIRGVNQNRWRFKIAHSLHVLFLSLQVE